MLAEAGLAPADIAIVIHGTTLATNAIIERKGARTALVTTEGFRDVLALRNESRYDQYDLNISLPQPLVPRRLRLPVPERLDNARAGAAAARRGGGARAMRAAASGKGSRASRSASCTAFVNPAHERRAREILRSGAAGPADLALLARCRPEMRE